MPQISNDPILARTRRVSLAPPMQFRSFTDHLTAAKALSAQLNSLGVRHAYIGGFAWAMLGSTRPTEINVLIEDKNISGLREKVKDLDPRFADFGLKLYYVTQTPDGQLIREELLRASTNNVLVETLPAGALGLPVAIVSLFNIDNIGINILHPAILILTKFKRWSISYTSTRPKTLRKAASDRNDIKFIVEWLAEREECIRFHGYEGKTKPELLTMIRKYHDKYIGDVPQMQKLQSIMPDDWNDMLDLPEPRVESLLPP